MGVDHYFVKIAGSWRRTTDPEVHRTDFWVDRQEGDQGWSHNRYYFNGVDDAIEFCQESPENITGLSGLMRVVMKDKPEEFSQLK
jgi:hypothetical protein